jgi:hypothetical protein
MLQASLTVSHDNAIISVKNTVCEAGFGGFPRHISRMLMPIIGKQLSFSFLILHVVVNE